MMFTEVFLAPWPAISIMFAKFDVLIGNPGDTIGLLLEIGNYRYKGFPLKLKTAGKMRINEYVNAGNLLPVQGRAVLNGRLFIQVFSEPRQANKGLDFDFLHILRKIRHIVLPSDGKPVY
jgi:hypothetical protein